MYSIKVDGRLMYAPALMGDGYKALSPKLHLEIGQAGSLDFTLLPCNALYDAVHKMRSILTVEQDGEEIFRCRAKEESTDFYGQKQIYCEGDLCFLLDSLQAPFEFEGTPAQLFVTLLDAHNAQMEESKRFAVGDVSGLDDTTTIKIASTSYADTMSTMQSALLEVYGGYLRTRKAGGVYYLDYLKKYGRTCQQKIKLGVNMLDMEKQIDSSEVCTVLVPLGATAKNGGALTVAEVNGGSIFVEDADLIAKYGRIAKSYTWDKVTDPAQLLTLAQQYLQQMAMAETLTIRAVDMYLIDGSTDKIRLGDSVQLESRAHGLDRESICTAMEIDLENGDQSEYTFGFRPQTLADQTASTAQQVDSMRGSINDQHRWLTETDTALTIAVEAINLIGHRTSQVEADIDAAEAAITLKANQSDMDILGTRLTGAEARIDGAEAAIELKAAQATVDAMGQRVTAAELRIDGAESAIALKADLIALDGFVKMEDFEALEGSVDALTTDGLSTGTVTAGSGDFDALWCGELNGRSPSWKGQTVMTGISSVNQSKRYLSLMTSDGGTVTLDIVTNVEITPSTAYINYLGQG